MPTTFLTGSLSGPQNFGSDNVVVLAAGSLLTSNNNGIVATDFATDNLDIVVYGTILANARAVDMFSSLNATGALNNSSVTVGESGVLFGQEGIVVEDGLANRITNFGQINALSTGIFASSGISEGIFRIDNGGTISSVTGPAIVTNSENNVRISNSGLLVSQSEGMTTFTVAMENFGSAELINSGRIVGANSGAINASSGSNAFTFHNTGTVEGSVFVNATATVTNSGTIIGDLDFQGGNLADSYTALGDGVVTGLVQGGSGEDTLTGGSEADRLDGGSGADRLAGMGGDDILLGGTEADTLRGGDGDDRLDGESSADRLAGNAGDDTLLGGGNTDALFGGTGDDALEGGTANDTLLGGDGDDVLIGGAGTDEMAGGAGADSFVFLLNTESGLGALRDIIEDFTRGEDVIDLRAVSAGTLLFLAPGAPFAGTPAVRVTETASGNSILNIDTDGVGAQDMQITLLGVTGLTADDFLL